MARERPAILLVMAILNFVFGGIGVLCGCCGVASVAGLSALGNISMKGAKGEENPLKDMMTFLGRELPGYQAIEIGHAALLILLCIVLIVSGIGLIMVKNWGRWLAVTFAVLIIPLQIGHMVYQIAFVQPAMEKWTKQFLVKQGAPVMQPTAADSTINKLQTIGTGSVTILYGLVLGVVMFLPPVSAAFAAAPVRRKRPRIYEDEDEHEGGRRRRADPDEDDEGRFGRRPRDD